MKYIYISFIFLLLPQFTNAQSLSEILKRSKAEALLQEYQLSHTIKPSKKNQTESVVQEENINNQEVYEIADKMPSFPGGNAALMNYLSQNIKYPIIAEKNGVQGRVLVEYVVGKDGYVSDVRVAKSVDPSLDKEAIRVVKGMPKWIPGEIDGEAVTVRYTLPVTFRLN